MDRHEYFLLNDGEFNHYVMLADMEHVMGRKISADTVQLPEEKKLGDLRRGYVDDELTQAAVGFEAVARAYSAKARSFRAIPSTI